MVPSGFSPHLMGGPPGDPSLSRKLEFPLELPIAGSRTSTAITTGVIVRWQLQQH